jgi:hypothetical protein
MAIIDGRAPAPPEPAGVARRVVVKFREGVDLPAAGSALRERRARGWDRLPAATAGRAFTPYITSPAGEPQGRRGLDAVARASASPSRARAALGRYFATEVAAGDDAEALARQLAALEDVESAYVEGGPTPPPVFPADDPRSSNQGYLDAAPDGIDARYAWTIADGNGVGFVDMERGWTLNHEDLAAAGITIISGQNRDFQGHGTAVLGEVVAVDNTTGGIGIAPRAAARVISQWRTATNYNTADAITGAAAVMQPGDVLLLEAQTSHANASGYVPVEVEDAVFDAIRAAVDDGIIVVEAGANGSVDLDAFTSSAGRQVLNRASNDFRDSGAIMVGAASSTAPHSRLSFSNFGSRIDCYAWGESIDTCGDGWTGTSTTAYTAGFGGTSGATPIVAGAAILLQSFGRKRGGAYTPSHVRALLSDTRTNTASSTPATDRIGVMPDLRAIIQRELDRDSLRLDRWKLVAKVLFGVANDGGGVVWIPGTGPVPVDPWGPLMIERVSVEVRDMLAALAVHELAELSEDEASVRAVRKASLAAVRRATERLAEKAGGKR